MATNSKVTNQQFAERVGIHHSMASRLFNGQRMPSIELMVRISEEYGIPVNKLLAARIEGPQAMSDILHMRIS